MRAATFIPRMVALGLAASAAAQAGDEEPEFTDRFPLWACDFATTGGNPFFLLHPGRQLYYSNANCLAEGECDELEELWITVTPRTRKVTLDIGRKRHSISTRIVEEKETADGELVEISRNFFASCRPSRDVYYFGETVDIYEDGEVVSHDGAWLAGKHGARPGIIMPDSAFIAGSRYFQEVAPGVALDRAEHVEVGVEATVPAGTFKGCVRIEETSPLEPGDSSEKIHCPGVGMVTDNDLELMAIYGRDDDDDDDDDDD